MIQYKNFLIKREQSRAGSRFAECEKSRLKAKLMMTLALLLTAVTGAWAAEPTIYTKGVENGPSYKNYIWYYIKGDDTHSDSEIFGPIEVSVWVS